MAPRATNTTLCFGLLTAEVQLYRTAGEAEKPRPWDRDPEPQRPEAERVATRRADPLASTDAPQEATAVAAPAAPRKGIRREDGSFLDLTDEIAAIDDRTRLEEMRVADFIRTEEIHRDRILGSYYLAPNGPGAAKVIALMCHAMRETRRVACVKFTKRSKQSLAVLVPHPAAGLVVVELAWAEDVRSVPERCIRPEMVALSGEERQLAVEMVQAMSSSRAEALDTLADYARALRRELVEKAEAGLVFEVPERPVVSEGADVIELMARALRDPAELARSAA